MGTGIDENMIHKYASIISCDVMNILFAYLGMSVGGNQRRNSLWDGIVEKIKKRLIRWNLRYLSFADKICLLKYYYSSFFKCLFLK